MELYKNDRRLRDRFRGLLLGPRFGLRVYLVRDAFDREYVVLRPDNMDISLLLQELVSIPTEEN